MKPSATYLSWVNFKTKYGFIPVIIQEYDPNQKGKVMMLTHTNEEAYRLTTETGQVHFCSSENGLPQPYSTTRGSWRVEESWRRQVVLKEIQINETKDVLLYLVISEYEVNNFNRVWPT